MRSVYLGFGPVAEFVADLVEEERAMKGFGLGLLIKAVKQPDHFRFPEPEHVARQSLSPGLCRAHRGNWGKLPSSTRPVSLHQTTGRTEVTAFVGSRHAMHEAFVLAELLMKLC